MKKHKWYWALIAISLMALICSTAGCISIDVPDDSGSPAATDDSMPPLPYSTPDEAEPSSEFLSYTDEANGFSVSYPKDWEPTVEGGEVDFEAPETAGYPSPNPSFLIAWFDLPPEMSLRSAFDEALAESETESAAGYRVVSEEEIAVDGVPAIKRIFTSTPNGEPRKGAIIALMRGKSTWLITFICAPESFDSLEPTFDAMVDSFHVFGTALSGKPDLAVTEIWFAGQIVYYKIKNQGGADAKASYSYLYVNDLEEAKDYIEPVAAGEERTESFASYQWRFQPPDIGSGTPSQVLASAFYVKVCADAKGAVEEGDEDNNCTNIIWGPTFTYDFVEKAHLATWRSGAGELEWPMVATDTRGAAFYSRFALEDGISYDNGLATYPQHVSHGSIQGTYGDYYSRYMETRSRELILPRHAKFIAKAGFREGATETEGVKVAFGVIDVSGKPSLYPGLDIYYDGKLDVYEVDLSHLAGEKVYLILRVEAKESGEQNWVVWVDPKIIQEP